MQRIAKVLRGILYFFTGLGILGIIGCLLSLDIFGVVFYIVWSGIGYFLLRLILKKYPAPKKIARNTSPHKNRKITKKKKSSDRTLPPPAVEKNNDSTLEPAISKGPDITVPSQKDGASLVYHYGGQPINDLNYDAVFKLANDKSWELIAKSSDSKVLLYSGDILVGSLGGKRVEMLSDWIRRDEPYLIYLNSVYPETHEATAFLAFYRDFTKYFSDREQTIVKLTNYRSEDAQFSIMWLKGGEKLEIEECDDKVEISDIGRLPSKIATRVLEEGCAACIFDHSDYDLDKDLYTPFVKIFW